METKMRNDYTPRDIFKTRRLNFACWVHSEQLLEYRGCVYSPKFAKVEFVFDDPRQMGNDLQDQYDEGAGATNAEKLFSSLHELRRAMTETKLNAQAQIQKANAANGEANVNDSHPSR
jgi:hypothetical protein